LKSKKTQDKPSYGQLKKLNTRKNSHHINMSRPLTIIPFDLSGIIKYPRWLVFDDDDNVEMDDDDQLSTSKSQSSDQPEIIHPFFRKFLWFMCKSQGLKTPFIIDKTWNYEVLHHSCSTCNSTDALILDDPSVKWNYEAWLTFYGILMNRKHNKFHVFRKVTPNLRPIEYCQMDYLVIRRGYNQLKLQEVYQRCCLYYCHYSWEDFRHLLDDLVTKHDAIIISIANRIVATLDITQPFPTTSSLSKL
jgi:hypothetical protein